MDDNIRYQDKNMVWENPLRHLTYLADLTKDHCQLMKSTSTAELNNVKMVNMSLLANMKLQLKKAQLAEKLEYETNTSVLAQSHNPVSSESQVINVPFARSIHSSGVPDHILEQVQTELKNPTKFHIYETKTRQVKTLNKRSVTDSPAGTMTNSSDLPLNGSIPVESGSPRCVKVSRSATIGSQVQTELTNPTKFHEYETKTRQVKTLNKRSVTDSPAGTMTNSSDLPLNGSIPVESGSPRCVKINSSATIGSKMDNLLSDILSLETFEATMDHDLNSLETSPMNTPSMPNIASNVSEMTDVASCPATILQNTEISPLPTEQLRLQNRKKRNNQNMIERRRRLNLKDRIKELGSLLPTTFDLHSRQKQGPILKASVEYVRKLKTDQERNRRLEERQFGLEHTNRKMLFRIQQLELLVQQKDTKPSIQDDSAKFHATDQIKQQQNISTSDLTKQNFATVVTVSPLDQTNQLMDDLMDNTSPLNSTGSKFC